MEDFRRVVQALAGSADPADIAAAAIKLVYQSHGGEREEEEIPAIARAERRNPIVLRVLHTDRRASRGIVRVRLDPAPSRWGPGQPEPCGFMSGLGGRQASGRAILSAPLRMKQACRRA